MQAGTRLPLALADFGLIHEHPSRLSFGIRVVPEPADAARCGNGANTKPGFDTGAESLPNAPTGTVATPWWWTGPASKR